MPDLLIYKTTSPAALAWYRDYLATDEDAKKRWNDFDALINDTFGPLDGNPETKRKLMMSDGNVVGITRSAAEAAERDAGRGPFKDWREHPRFDAIIPKKNTKVGKEWHARISSLPHRDVRETLRSIGQDSMAFTGMRVYRPGLDFDLDDNGDVTAIYVTWGSTDVDADNGDIATSRAHHPEVVWEKLPLSAWYARQEAVAVA